MYEDSHLITILTCGDCESFQRGYCICIVTGQSHAVFHQCDVIIKS